eukprot:365924-Chlamydomonas_euryale.AAC.5
MHQTGSARSCPTSTTARCGRKGRHKGRKQFSKPDCTGEGRSQGTGRPKLIMPVQHGPNHKLARTGGPQLIMPVQHGPNHKLARTGGPKLIMPVQHGPNHKLARTGGPKLIMPVQHGPNHELPRTREERHCNPTCRQTVLRSL